MLDACEFVAFINYQLLIEFGINVKEALEDFFDRGFPTSYIIANCSVVGYTLISRKSVSNFLDDIEINAAVFAISAGALDAVGRLGDFMGVKVLKTNVLCGRRMACVSMARAGRAVVTKIGRSGSRKRGGDAVVSWRWSRGGPWPASASTSFWVWRKVVL